MRVLVANIPLPSNRFLTDLNEELSRLCDLQQSSDAFWRMQGEYDLVHLHFPEYLTYEIERAYADGLTAELVSAVEQRLSFWSSRSRIVVTRHNLMPHNAPDDPRWAQLYAAVYKYADGIVHLGGSSVEEFGQRYRGASFGRGKPPQHTVIPIQNYSSLPNSLTQSEARSNLRIPADASVMLVFGAIRSDAERDLVLQTFSRAKVDRKLLLVSRWRETLPDVAWIRLKYWLRDLKRQYHRLHRQHYFNYGFVEEGDTQLYLNAADILFIPRIDVLNSANVSLGFTFGRVVVGPDSLNPGELLRKAGNPVFEPRDPDSATAAVEEGFRLARVGLLGEDNRRVALNDWGVRSCGAQYVQFFTEIVSAISQPELGAE